MQTLKDYLDYNLEILSIGLNPSTISVERGYYFANPRNRFWKALNASGLVNKELIPSQESQEILLRRYKIGFTDVIKRHSSMGKELRVVDYKKWSPILKQTIHQYQPKICWIHGKVAAKNLLQYGGFLNTEVIWGLQDFSFDNSEIFVTPNPSPANAVYSLQDLIDWYKKLEVLRCEMRD